MSFTPVDRTPEVKKRSTEIAKDVKEDFLSVDPPIPGQNFVCLSFVSPENTIKERHSWYLQQFFRYLTQKLEPATNMEAPKYSTRFEQFMAEQDGDITYDKVRGMWDDYLFLNQKVLSEQYDKETDFQTSVRGLKVRGVYASNKEARFRANQLSKTDDSFHIFVAQVGYWLPWDPIADDIEDQEYQEAELNLLVKKYNENKENRDLMYEERRREKLKEAREDTLRKKKELEEEHKDQVDKERAIAKELGAVYPENDSGENVKSQEEKDRDAKDTIDKLRSVVAEKNRLLNEAMEAKRKAEREQEKAVEAEILANTDIPVSSPVKKTKKQTAKKVVKESEVNMDTERDKPSFNPSPETGVAVVGEDTNVEETAQTVFNNEDIWMKRKQETTEPEKKKRGRPRKNKST